MLNQSEQRLKINEKFRTRRGAFRTTEDIVYAGMISDDVYSVVLTFSLGHNSWAYNLYLPVSQRELKLWDVRLVVLQVTPTEIHFRVERE